MPSNSRRQWGSARIAALAVALAVTGQAHARLPVVDPPLMPEAPADYRAASLSGGPGKDGIPAIDNPAFQAASEADARLDDGDRVVGLYHDGEARAYPQSILVWHEIVNDTVAGENIAVTYCPLTGTALGYLRGETTLGVSGRLVNSNLIMFDRASDSLWPQILSAGIGGPHEGQGLEEVRVVWTTWGRWRERHPDTRVLTTDTGYLRNYNRDPYGGYNPVRGYYAPNASPIFPVRPSSDRYPPKEEVFGIRTASAAVALDRDHLAAAGVVNIPLGDDHLVVVHDPGLDTGWAFRADEAVALDPTALRFGPEGPVHPELADLERVNGFEAMWFAWYAFYPDTVVVDGAGR
ncbi:DUF3179 domain-containing protein [Alkalilimnicola ehrlichii MLHE-1]|uniref:DUF3179 domain-containing protein n=1 Tax=Alkalilimnicola ehrlichii (strain ATCC BAA-1101 / DSM 17681 / MLHE-1) TaxID=187272 RepID=Q0A5P5_ALKEH|nr:DUF3179 domain-containing protein [Alkalilimnicola ehrlichii]ABI57842.1 conserved hypothetical protein [Alkalilimnicola ehrlichii MLHE-1]